MKKIFLLLILLTLAFSSVYEDLGELKKTDLYVTQEGDMIRVTLKTWEEGYPIKDGIIFLKVFNYSDGSLLSIYYFWTNSSGEAEINASALSEKLKESNLYLSFVFCREKIFSSEQSDWLTYCTRTESNGVILNFDWDDITSLKPPIFNPSSPDPYLSNNPALVKTPMGWAYQKLSPSVFYFSLNPMPTLNFTELSPDICIPLALILGLSLAAMMAVGQNPLFWFSFSGFAPRRIYTPRFAPTLTGRAKAVVYGTRAVQSGASFAKKKLGESMIKETTTKAMEKKEPERPSFLKVLGYNIASFAADPTQYLLKKFHVKKFHLVKGIAKAKIKAYDLGYKALSKAFPSKQHSTSQPEKDIKKAMAESVVNFGFNALVGLSFYWLFKAYAKGRLSAEQTYVMAEFMATRLRSSVAIEEEKEKLKEKLEIISKIGGEYLDFFYDPTKEILKYRIKRKEKIEITEEVKEKIRSGVNKISERKEGITEKAKKVIESLGKKPEENLPKVIKKLEEKGIKITEDDIEGVIKEEVNFLYDKLPQFRNELDQLRSKSGYSELVNKLKNTNESIKAAIESLKQLMDEVDETKELEKGVEKLSEKLKEMYELRGELEKDEKLAYTMHIEALLDKLYNKPNKVTARDILEIYSSPLLEDALKKSGVNLEEKRSEWLVWHMIINGRELISKRKIKSADDFLFYGAAPLTYPKLLFEEEEKEGKNGEESATEKTSQAETQSPSTRKSPNNKQPATGKTKTEESKTKNKNRK